MGELGALFNPGMRHELEERQAKAARREEEGNAKDGDLRIDLESGVAVINILGSGDEQSPTGTADPGPAAEADADAAGERAGSAGSRTAARRAEAGSDGSTDPDESGELSSAVPPVQQATTNEPAGTSSPALRPRGKRGMSTSSW